MAIRRNRVAGLDQFKIESTCYEIDLLEDVSRFGRGSDGGRIGIIDGLRQPVRA